MQFSLCGPTILAVLALSVPAAAQTVDLEEADLVVPAGSTADVVINGETVRFRIAPDAISVPTVNADTATRLGLEPSLVGFVYVVGATQLPFRTDTVRYGMQGDTFRRRTAFGTGQVVEGADGVAGPASFPHRRTILTLRDSQPEDRAITFPLDEEMGRSQTGTWIGVDGRPIYVAFSFARDESLVTATGGRWIADALGGYFEGEARDIPILYGVERPVRTLALTHPLMLGELEIRNLAVRVSDVGSSAGIAEGGLEPVDPSEIVVTANSGRDVPNQRMYLGLDTIGHCASITYDFEAETVTLMCPPQPAPGA